MRKAYYTINDVLRSPWVKYKPDAQKSTSTDRVLRSTKLEDSIYADLRNDDPELERIEQEASAKMASFPALTRDVFQSFYSLMPRRQETDHLSAAAQRFNAPILDHVLAHEDYPTLKAVCEGRELPAYEAAEEFITKTAGELDDLLSSLGGDKGSVNTLEKLEAAQAKAESELSAMLERMEKSGVYNETLEQAIIEAANTAESKRRQAEAVGKKISADAARNQEEAAMLVARAVTTAAKKAQEVQSILASWSDEPGNMEKSALNRKMLDTVRQSDVLKRVSEYLGRFREIFAQGKRNSYAYGRGEKYSLELGRDLTRALSSELVMLASPETLPLFLRKYQRGQIKQYCRREPIFKGAGDIICCLDESSSTKGEPAAWGKAVALTLLEIAADGGRKFALVHFSGSDSIQTDLFLPGSYTAADKMAAAETFLGGGTNFQMPLDEALRLMEENGFENADVVFITDGECALSDEYAALLGAEQVSRRFTVTGVLLDKGKPAMDFSLKPFCQVIYRTSELVGDEIVQKLVDQRV
jgi:uncharacterized protein with von Willebrand factor type A (vWA) domain